MFFSPPSLYLPGVTLPATNQAPDQAPITTHPAELPPLSLRHRILADSFLLSGNKAQAGRDANYAPGGASDATRRALQRPEVLAYIERRKAELEDQYGLSRDDVALQLRAVGLSDITHYTLTDDGELKLADGAPPNAMGAVARFKKKVRTSERTDKNGDIIVDKTVDVEFALWPKVEALRIQAEILELVGKNAPSLGERMEAGVEVQGPGGNGEPSKVTVLVRVRRE
mgnify:CR=1 FL=1